MNFERDKFEKFVRRFHIGAVLDSYDLEGDVVYEDWNVQSAWVVWQESRKHVEISLPPKTSAMEGKDPYWNNVRNETIDACARSILKSGLNLK